jgi:hypothetical protein
MVLAYGAQESRNIVVSRDRHYLFTATVLAFYRLGIIFAISANVWTCVVLGLSDPDMILDHIVLFAVHTLIFN